MPLVDRPRATVHRMPIYELGEWKPTIDPTAFVHPDAVVIGDVRIGAEASIWPGAVLRGDGGGYIEIGAGTSIQDNSVLHTVPGCPTVVGERALIGHIVHLEGCTIESGAMVGNAAQVLHRSIVRTGAIVAANSVVLYDVEVPAGALAVGSPAVIKEGRADATHIQLGVESYMQRARTYPTALRRIG